ncbi:MAG: phosphomannose isomerase type II C-terminal cupin domain [Synechococcaceae cyanobacterium]
MPQPDQCNEREDRPWGWFETLGRGDGYLLKRLCIGAGRRISRQRHRHRCEHWVVVQGEGWLECDGRQVAARAGTTLFIPIGAIHRAGAGGSDLLIIEVQRGAPLSEDDIERLADDYGRGPIPERLAPTGGGGDVGETGPHHEEGGKS